MKKISVGLLLVLFAHCLLAQTVGVWHDLHDKHVVKPSLKEKTQGNDKKAVEKLPEAPVAADTINVKDTSFHTGNIMLHMYIDVSCDSVVPHCDSLRALRDPCFAEYLIDKSNQQDCDKGATNCTITFKINPLLVDETLIRPRPAAGDRVWLFILLTFQLMVVVYLRLAFYKGLEDTIKAYFNINLSQQLFREQEPSQPFSAFLMVINFVVSITLFTYLVSIHLLQFKYSPLVLLGVIALGITVLYTGKYLMMRIVAWLFPFGDEMSFYSFNFFVNQKLLGILLIPFNFVIAFAPSQFTLPIIIVCVVLTGATMLVRSFRGLVIAKNYIASYKVHFFIYICTLEIAPVLIIYKLIIKGLH